MGSSAIHSVNQNKPQMLLFRPGCGRAGDGALAASLVALGCAEVGSQAMGRLERDMSALGTVPHSQRPCLSPQDINMG